MKKEIDQEISDIKIEIKNISVKIDLILDILNSFTIMLSEEDVDETYGSEDSDESWVPKEDDFWEENEEGLD